MKDKIFEVLQRVGRSFMLPIAILPIAGILLGIGRSFTNETMLKMYHLMGIMGPGTIVYTILKLCGDCGNAIFINLPLIFAIGVAVGMSKAEKEVAALSGAIAFFIMHTSISVMISVYGGEKALPAGAIDSVLGITTLQMGVFGGVIVGLGVAFLHNRFYKIKLPEMLSFFGGTRFVPIISTIVYIFVGILMFYIWQPIQGVMYGAGGLVRASGYFGTFIYGVMERVLIPFGLHHVFYLPFWQTSLGGTMEIAGKLVEGAQNIFFAQLADPTCVSFSVEATRFMAGKFPFMIFGLPGAALAMYQCAKPKNKRLIGGLLLSASLTSILTGITEPIEFSFLFVAPILYVIHCGFAGLSYMLMHILKVRVGMTFSGGLIDMFLFGILQGQDKTNWMMFIPVGIAYFLVYYFLFKFLILKFNWMTPGREEEIEQKQMEKVEEETTDSPYKSNGVSITILAGLGGKSNLVDIDCCITRLRCTVKDARKVRDDILTQTGFHGIIKKGNAIQIICGPSVTVIKSELEDYIRTTGNAIIDEDVKRIRREAKVKNNFTEEEIICNPIKGTVISLDEVEDEVFSEGMLGEGFAVEPDEGAVYAPVKGMVSALFDTHHAIGITSEQGAEVLIHIGIDTVNLGGEGFHIKVEPGVKVKVGDILATFDLEDIKNQGYCVTTPVIITNSMDYTSLNLKRHGRQKAKSKVLSLKK